MATTPETFTGYWCEQESEVVEPVPVYECATCGERSDERRCSSCNLFKPREGSGCPECFEEVEEVDLVVDHDGTTIRVEDFDADGASFAVREAERNAELLAAREASRAEAREAALAASTPVPWSEIRPGDRIVNPEASHLGPSDLITVLDVLVTGDAATGIAAGTVVTVTDRYSVSVSTHSGDEIVQRSTLPAPTNLDVATPAERVRVEDAPDLWSGSGVRAITLRLGKGDDFTMGCVPAACIYGSSSSSSGALSALAVLIDAETARAFASAARQASEHLDINGGRRPEQQDVVLSVEEDTSMFSNLTRWVTFRRGDDTGDKLVQILTEQKKGRGAHSATVTDRVAMLTIADAADQAAQWLDEQTDARRA